MTYGVVVGKKIVTLLKKKPHGKPKVLKVSKHRTGKIKSYRMDKARKAMRPGKRRSRTGKVYYEYRRNRSDVGLW